MHRPPVHTSLARGLKSASSSTRRRSFTSQAPLALWGGTTHPYDNPKIPPSPAAGTGIAIPSPNAEPTRIERLHRKHVQKLLDLTAASMSGLESSWDTRLKSAVPPSKRKQTHSLSEPPLFRTDGPLTPYPIELDSGEVLEPTHATLVRVMDRSGEERKIVVAELEGENGKKKRILLTVDLKEYQKEDGSVPMARRVSGEDVYKAVDLEPPKV